MGFVKSYGTFLVSLLVGLIALSFVLKVAKKAPVVGGVAQKAEDLAGLQG